MLSVQQRHACVFFLAGGQGGSLLVYIAVSGLCNGQAAQLLILLLLK